MIISEIVYELRKYFKSGFDNVEKNRKFLETLSAFAPDFHFKVKKEVIQFENFDAEWLKIKNATHHVILYLHGGGYTSGSANTHRSLVSEICEKGNFNALIPNYRLAPENPYPCGFKDAVSSYNYLLENGYAPHQIIIAGDSAGGGLTMALLYYLKDHQQPLPKAAILICPWTDLKNTGKSIQKENNDPFINTKAMDFIAHIYVNNNEKVSHPYISPLYGNVKNLPPIYIQAGGKDPIRDDAIRLHQKIIEYGGKSKLEVFPGMFHVWHAFYFFLPDGRKALNSIATFARYQFDLS